MARILVVDDDPSVTETITRVLAEHECRTATNGLTALAIFQQWDADLLITDMAMPHMHGGQLIRQVQKRSDIPILAISALDSTLLESMERFGYHTLAKPFRGEEIVDRVEALLRKHISTR